MLQEAILSEKRKMETVYEYRFDLFFSYGIGWELRIFFISPEKNRFEPPFIKSFVQRFLTMQDTWPGYRITFIAGRARERLEMLQDSYKRVKNAAEHRHVLPGHEWRLVFADEYETVAPEAQEVVLPTDTLLRHIRQGAAKEVAEDIRKIYEPFHKGKYITLSDARMITTELAVTAFKGMTAAEDGSVSYLYYLNHIQHLNTLEDLERDIAQFAVHTAEQRTENNNQRKSLAYSALEYVRRNFAQENLTLKDVAEAMNISVPYLAVLFKQETGQTFGAHLLTIRMEKAKELLRTTDATVAELAERVGYSSAQYFAVRFKKYTGMSPGAWREQG